MKKYLTFLLALIMSLTTITSLCACSDSSDTETSSRIATTDTALNAADSKLSYTTTFNELGGFQGIHHFDNIFSRSISISNNEDNPGDVQVYLQQIKDGEAVKYDGVYTLKPGETATFKSTSGFNTEYIIYAAAVSVTGDYTFTVDW